MKSKNSLFIFILLMIINSVYAQRIKHEEPEKIKDPDMQFHAEEIFAPEEKIETHKFTPDEVALIKPTWICPSNSLHWLSNYNKANGYKLELSIHNFTRKAAFVRVIFYDNVGRVKKTFDWKIEPKFTLSSFIEYADVSAFKGAIEIQSDTREIYPQALLGHQFYSKNGKDDYRWESVAALSWYRLDQ